MTDTQLYIAIGVPVVSNAIMLMIFSTIVGFRLSAFEAAINRTELRRVEDVLDARLKHLEETRG